MPGRKPGGDPLSRALQELRDAAGLRQVDAAARANVSQALIARFETGRQVPRPDQVEKLCEVYGTPAAERRHVVEMAQDARGRVERVVMHRDMAPAGRKINRIATTAKRERTFSPSGIPALLQTAAYASALFHAEPNLTPEAAEEALTVRLDGQSVLDDTEHEFGFLIPEGALGWSLLQPPQMAEQIEHLARFTYRSNITLGLIPWGYPTPVLPLNSFALFDDRLVITGTTTRVAYLTVRTDLDAYSRLYEQLAEFAVYRDEAHAILTQTANRYRNLDW